MRYEILRSKEELPNIQDMEVGLENRLYRCALDNDDFSGFYSDLMTKRYTNARMQRVLTHIILGITVITSYSIHYTKLYDKDRVR